MTGRDRFLTALHNQMPDRLPCQVHSWMPYYLKTYLKGMDQYQAYEYFHMDPVIYTGPAYRFRDSDLAKWETKDIDLGIGEDGYHHYRQEIRTPKGRLSKSWACNQYTRWETSYIIKTPQDFELWEEFFPRPAEVDWTPVVEAKKRIGETGIVRGSFWDFGQGSPWQSFSSYLFGTEEAIMACFDMPDWVHHVLRCLLNRKLEAIEIAGKQEFDLVECGGGAGSSTVISPALHREFCLPYDIAQINALHTQGTLITYHLCGGLMPLLETVKENGCDALETMTPPSMGGDCDLTQAQRRVGNALCFIGGFDQNQGFENGNPETIRTMVRRLFEACPQGGYICSPSDHFFGGAPDNIRLFAQACAECVY